MDQEQPLNSINNIGLFKKIFLYQNVCCFKILMSKSNPGHSIHDNRTLSFSASITAVFEIVILNYVCSYLDEGAYINILIALLIFHVLIAFVFEKDILALAVNFNTAYPKWLFTVYVALLLIGLVGGLIILNNQIGHLPSGK